MKIGNEDVKLYLGDSEVEKIYLGTEQVFEGEEPTPVPYSGQYLTFVAEADNCTIQAVDAHSNVFQYSVDSGTTWSDLANNASTTAVNSGQTIMFKASGLTVDSSDGIGTLKPSVSASVQGNVMSLVYGDNFSGQATMRNDSQFRGLFYNCANITSAENLILPAPTLAPYCYRSMFYGCTSLTTAPELPATTLADNCYYQMFQGCTSLTTAPVLPATTLGIECCQYMFKGCTSLNSITCLATDISATDCTYNWVYGVAGTGTFVKAASMNDWQTGYDGIPDGWTVQNDDGSPVISLKYTATYTDGTVVTASCNDSGSVLVINEISKTNLKTVVLGECVTRISGECFSDCSKLESVTIDGNTTIDAYSFARNNGTLKTIRMQATTPPQCDSKAFTYYKSGSGYIPMESIRIYVPSASVSRYKAASGWNTYSSKIYGY